MDDDILCRGHILNALSNSVYSAHRASESAKLIVSDLKIVEIDLSEAFKVGVTISKLPNSWNGYKKKLKHDDKKHSLKSLMHHLRIEEDSRK
ncbi:hypothetical protein GIB67_002007 [Kingdonia uniflora]|uniref:Uncharacterized protein n=1 Tax=Kingdonia uniflora TaxID=39325 RepID=A0A7J7MAC2_9MAGN|nr:hypothetical protein GIB67_002007 [Kingdonia uniflora]